MNHYIKHPTYGRFILKKARYNPNDFSGSFSTGRKESDPQGVSLNREYELWPVIEGTTDGWHRARIITLNNVDYKSFDGEYLVANDAKEAGTAGWLTVNARRVDSFNDHLTDSARAKIRKELQPLVEQALCNAVDSGDIYETLWIDQVKAYQSYLEGEIREAQREIEDATQKKEGFTKKLQEYRQPLTPNLIYTGDS